MKKVRIVPMAAEHLNEVAALELACFSRPWSRQMLAEELDNQCAAFLVALEPQLLQVFDDFARGNRLAFLTLEVRSSNAAAIALYRGFGFREVGRRRNYYDLPKEDALILTKYYAEEAQA